MTPDHFRLEHFVILFLLALGALAFMVVRRRQSVAKGEAVEGTDSIAPRIETPRCVCCAAPHPTEAAPQLIEVRSLIDSSWVDDMLLKLGFQRSVRHAVNVLRDIDVRPTLCRECFRIARARCEDKVAAIQAARSKALVAESEDVARFASFALVELVRASVSQQRQRNDAAQGGRPPEADPPPSDVPGV